jgi:16S rRNA (cytidine1402-2'-O)-methyltransferase
MQTVDLIACEDTRHTRKLLAQFSISTLTSSYHEHNEESKALLIREQLMAGKDVALVSDAGTPLLSDPGYRLVRLCRQSRIPVLPVPGPFAGAAACSASGLPTDEILFVGFLPTRASVQRSKLERLSGVQATLVFYLAPHRLQQTLERITEILGDRDAYLVREMTKIYETSHWGTLSAVAEEVSAGKPRGEYTLVVTGAGETAPVKRREDDFDIAAYVAGLIQRRGLSKKEAMKVAAAHLGIPKREVYGLMIENS